MRIFLIEGDEVIIEFEGFFCVICGFYDYFDDIKWEVMEFGFEFELVEVFGVVEDDFEYGCYVVKYKLGRKLVFSLSND